MSKSWDCLEGRHFPTVGRTCHQKSSFEGYLATWQCHLLKASVKCSPKAQVLQTVWQSHTNQVLFKGILANWIDAPLRQGFPTAAPSQVQTLDQVPLVDFLSNTMQHTDLLPEKCMTRSHPCLPCSCMLWRRRLCAVRMVSDLQTCVQKMWLHCVKIRGTHVVKQKRIHTWLV